MARQNTYYAENSKVSNNQLISQAKGSVAMYNSGIFLAMLWMLSYVCADTVVGRVPFEPWGIITTFT